MAPGRSSSTCSVYFPPPRFSCHEKRPITLPKAETIKSSRPSPLRSSRIAWVTRGRLVKIGAAVASEPKVPSQRRTSARGRSDGIKLPIEARRPMLDPKERPTGTFPMVCVWRSDPSGPRNSKVLRRASPTNKRRFLESIRTRVVSGPPDSAAAAGSTRKDFNPTRMGWDRACGSGFSGALET